MELLLNLKIISALIIFVIALIAGWWPFLRRRQEAPSVVRDFPLGESLATGIFFGAGLLHMLPEAMRDFANAGYHYPFALLIAGGGFLLLLLLEHLSVALQHDGHEHHHHTPHHHHEKHDTPAIAWITVVMLSVHSLLEGTAVGIAHNVATASVIVLAILAHKGAAAFALSVNLNRSRLNLNYRLFGFSIFVVMTPLGIIWGDYLLHAHVEPLAPIFTALAAGTFLYIGTLHGLDRANLIRHCCNLKEFFVMLGGFTLMAVVAVVT